jgi:hypothetical protein
MLKLTHISALIGLLFISGCFKTDAPDVYEDVEGVVLSANGDPVNKAHIHIRNHYKPGGFRVNETQATVKVNFNAPYESIYEGLLYHHGAQKPMLTFFRDTLQSGEHSIVIPDSLLSNGVYAYDVRSERASLYSSLFLINKPDSLLPATLPFAVTDAQGKFTLDPIYLAVNRAFNSGIGGRFVITDSLQIIVTDNSQVLKKRTVRVKPNQSNFLRLI